MKRIIKYILVSVLFVFSVTSVFAEDVVTTSDLVKVSDLPSNSLDSLGRCNGGSYMQDWLTSDSNQYAQQSFIYTFSQENINYMYMTFQQGQTYPYRLYVSYNGSYSRYVKNISFSDLQTAYDGDGVSEFLDDVVSDNNNLQTNVSGQGGTIGPDIITNIPVFVYGDDTSINNYITDGDMSGCINIDDVIPPPEIPYATNIVMSDTSKANSGKKYNNPIVVTWDSGFNSEYNYSNMRFNISYEAVIGKQLGALKSNTSSGLIQVAQHVSYQNERQTYTIGIEKLNHDLQILLGEIADVNLKSAWLESITVYIQNEDSSNSSYKSSIKFVAYDFITGIEDSSNPVVDDGSIGGGESDGDSSGTGDGTINNPSSNGSSSGTFTGTIKQEFPKWDLYNNLNNVITGKNSIIRDYIDNDFALFGSNPLFSVLGTVMPYMPIEYFNLLKLTMSVGCGMAVVGIIFRFLRG